MAALRSSHAVKSDAPATFAQRAQAELQLRHRRLLEAEPVIAPDAEPMEHNAGDLDAGVLALPVAREFEPFGEWINAHRTDFTWTARHFVAMQTQLDRITRGEIRRLYFSVPVRHGKTEHNTISYAAYRLAQNPKIKILVTSYNARRAEKFSRQIKKLARAVGVRISPERDTSGEWETIEGGSVTAIGAGAGTASINADLVIIDDPIPNREAGESALKRDKVWEWFTNDILGRADPKTAVIFTMSRWHEDDPAGRLLTLQREQWTVVDLPAEAEANDPLGRAIGEPLWPEERGVAWLAEKLIELLPYGFASLLQGRPRPREGGMFKWDWWQELEDVPAVGRMVRYWDLAGTEKKKDSRTHDPDYSAGALLCRMVDKRTAIVDVARFRKEIGHRDATVLNICKDDLEKYRGRISWWIETEAGINGAARTAELVRELQQLGMPVFTEHPTGSKVARAEPLASKALSKNVYLVKGAWNKDFKAEAADFPNHGKHDDQIDAAAGADSKLAILPVTPKVTVRRVSI